MAANNQVRFTYEPFNVGDALLKEPRDPDGPPEETFNCRCHMDEYPLSQLPTDLLPQVEGRLTDAQRRFLVGPPLFFPEDNDEEERERRRLVVNSESDRKKSIINETPAVFEIVENSDADDSKSWYESPSENQVPEFENIIVEEAKKQDVDPDLVKAIMYMETTRGYYDKLAEPFDANTSVLPMNVQTEYWKNLGYTREQLKDPNINIKVGVALLKRIEERIEAPTIDKIATIYNFLGAEMVNDYGARVRRIYEERLWEKPPPKFN